MTFPVWLANEDLTLERIEAVGVGFGGPVDVDQGVVISSHQVQGWDHFPLADWIRGTLGIARVSIANDADTAGLGEVCHGAGRGYSPVLYLTIGSGIGGSLVIGGQIYRGSGPGAIEIGHLRVLDTLASPSETHLRELELVASGWSITRRAREGVARRAKEYGERSILLDLAGGELGQIDTPLIARAALEDDPIARSVLDSAIAGVAEALAHAVTLLSPRRIILGGGVSLLGETVWLKPIRQALDPLVFPPFRGTFDVVAAALGESVVIHGALALARESCRP